MIIRSIFVFFLALSGISLRAEEDACYEEFYEDEMATDLPQVMVLNLENALTRALEANRQYINTYEGLQRSQLALEIALAEFDIKVTPNAEGGWTGGTNYKTGIKYGLGFDIYKKFQQGTKINFAPSIHKRNEHFHNDLNSTIIQPILRGFGRDYTMNGVYNAEFTVRSSIRSFYTAQVGLILKTIQALYEIVRSQETLKLNSESYDRLKGYYNAAKLKERIGMSDALDVYRAESEAKRAEETLTSSQVRFQDTLDNLRDLLALSLDQELRIEVPLVYNEISMDVDSAIETALGNRVEMDQARDQLEENYRMVRIAKDNLYPELNMIVNFNNSGADDIFNRTSFSKRQTTWSLGFTSSTDFNQTAQDAAYTQTILAVDSSRRGIEQSETNITIEVKKALRNLDQTYKKITLQKEQIHTTTGELRLSLLKFNRGFANNFDVIQAEKSLRSAEVALFGAVIDHIIGQYQLMSTLGLLADKPILNRSCN